MPHVMPANLEETQDISDLDMRPLMSPSPEQIREVVEFTSSLRETDEPFDVVACGITEDLDAEAAAAKLKAYEEAGATWWLEWLDCGRPETFKKVREQVQSGPPQ